MLYGDVHSFIIGANVFILLMLAQRQKYVLDILPTSEIFYV